MNTGFKPDKVGLDLSGQTGNSDPIAINEQGAILLPGQAGQDQRAYPSGIEQRQRSGHDMGRQNPWLHLVRNRPLHRCTRSGDQGLAFHGQHTNARNAPICFDPTCYHRFPAVCRLNIGSLDVAPVIPQAGNRHPIAQAHTANIGQRRNDNPLPQNDQCKAPFALHDPADGSDQRQSGINPARVQ